MKIFDSFSLTNGVPSNCVINCINDLNDDQIRALKRLKDKTIHLLPEYMKHDCDLIRWLIGRNFDVNKAETMLTESLEWRNKWNVDEIHSYAPPEVLQKYYAVGKSGYDKEGYPVWIIPYGGIDCKGILQSTSVEEFIKYTIKTLEEGPKSRDLRMKENHDMIYRQTVIFDLDNFSIRHFTWKPVVDAVIEIVKLYECNYPENLKLAYVINAPLMFKLLYMAVRPFVAQETVDKIKIFGSNEWKDELLENISADQLPVHYGGNMTDLDGNPKCLTKICYGGEVPEEYYLKNIIINAKCSDNFKSMSLLPEDRKNIEITATEKGNKI